MHRLFELHKYRIHLRGIIQLSRDLQHVTTITSIMMNINYREHFSWLNESTFQILLRLDRKNERIHVKDLVIEEALARGENYASQMLRVTVKFHDGFVDVAEPFIVKGMVIHGVPSIVTELRLFQKEIVNYQQVLPAVQSLLRSIGDDTVLSAK